MGFGKGSAGAAGTVFQLLPILFMVLFGVSLGQAIAAVSPSVQVAVLFNPFLNLILSTFCGVTIPYPTMIKVWRSWLYELNPYTRTLAAMVSTELQCVFRLAHFYRIVDRFASVVWPYDARETNLRSSTLRRAKHVAHGLKALSTSLEGTLTTWRIILHVDIASSALATSSMNHSTSVMGLDGGILLSSSPLSVRNDIWMSLCRLHTNSNFLVFNLIATISEYSYGRSVTMLTFLPVASRVLRYHKR